MPLLKRHDHTMNWPFSTAMVWGFRPKDLEEMTLLVDVSSDLHDVQEAHMRFRRQSDEPDELLAQFGQWDCFFLDS